MKKIKRWVENCFTSNPVPEFKPFLLKKIYQKPYNPTFFIYSLNGLSSQESVSLEEEFSGASLCRTHEEIGEFKEGVTKFICMLIQLHRLQLDHFSLAFT